MKSPPRFLSILSLCVLGLVGACSAEPSKQVSEATSVTGGTSANPETGLADVLPYGREPWPGIITAGQPSKKEFEALRDAGVGTVINLRVPSERGTRDEPEWMQELGMDYISIPVAGAQGLSVDAARELDRALEAAPRPVLVHCGSSNRVGAVFGLRAFHLEGKSREEALEIARSAGITRLEKILGDLLAEAN